MARLYAKCFEFGLRPDDLTYYPELAKKIVEQEMALRRRVTRDLTDDQNARVTQLLVRLARAARTYVIDRMFQYKVVSMNHFKNG
jgi:glucose-6-phosphate-specific signal transduction histidine kinase